MSLSRQEIEKAKFTFSIYDFEGNDRVDASQLGNALRAMGLNPTLRRISNLGGTRIKNEKQLTIEEFLAIYQDAKQDKEQGSAEEYLECLSGYDKDRTGKVSVSTLSHLLQGYGEEKLDKDEAQFVIEECGQPYDDEVDYRDFVKNLLKGPDIRIPPALLIQQARAGQSLEGDTADGAKAAAPAVSPQPRAVSRTSVKSNKEGNDDVDDDVSIDEEASLPDKSAASRKLSRKDSEGKSLKARSSLKADDASGKSPVPKSASFKGDAEPDSDDEITCASEVSLTGGVSEADISKGRSSSKGGIEIVDNDASEASEKPRSGAASRSSAKSKRSITKVS